MQVRDLLDLKDFKLITADKTLNSKEITGIYICDLLSWVLSHAKENDAWVTIHNHINIVAVAILTRVSCIIIPENIELTEDTINKANEENIPIISTNLTSYEIACTLYKKGV